MNTTIMPVAGMTKLHDMSTEINETENGTIELIQNLNGVRQVVTLSSESAESAAQVMLNIVKKLKREK